jgi:hypothetical protein
LAAMATDELLDVDVETRRGKCTKFLNKHTIDDALFFLFFQKTERNDVFSLLYNQLQPKTENNISSKPTREKTPNTLHRHTLTHREKKKRNKNYTHTPKHRHTHQQKHDLTGARRNTRIV